MFRLVSLPIVIKGKKVKCTLVQALRLCTGRTTHRERRGIALLFLDYGTRRSASRPGRSLPPWKTRYPLYRRLGGLQGRSGHVRRIPPPTGIRSPDRPARSQSLYRLLVIYIYIYIYITIYISAADPYNFHVRWYINCVHILLKTDWNLLNPHFFWWNRMVNPVQCHCACAMKDQSVFNCTKDVLYNIELSKMSLCDTDIEDSVHSQWRDYVQAVLSIWFRQPHIQSVR